MKENTIGFAFAVATLLAAFAHYYLGLDFIIVVALAAVTSTVYTMLKQTPAIPWWIVTALGIWLAISL